MTQANGDFDASERKIFRKLTTPAKIQRFLDKEIGYNEAHTCSSPRMVLRTGVAHCMEGAMFAAAALRELGHSPLVVDLEAVRDTDHVLAVYRVAGQWGAVAKSDTAGCGRGSRCTGPCARRSTPRRR